MRFPEWYLAPFVQKFKRFEDCGVCIPLLTQDIGGEEHGKRKGTHAQRGTGF